MGKGRFTGTSRTNQAIWMIFKDFKITFGGEIIRTFSFGGGHEARHRLEVKAELVVSQLDLGQHDLG